MTQIPGSVFNTTNLPCGKITVTPVLSDHIKQDIFLAFQLGGSRVVNLGTTTKLCYHIFVPKPHPGHIVVVARPKIG